MLQLSVYSDKIRYQISEPAKLSEHSYSITRLNKSLNILSLHSSLSQLYLNYTNSRCKHNVKISSSKIAL